MFYNQYVHVCHTILNCTTLQIAMRVGASCQDVKNVIIWGNHSVTQYPDVSHATVRGKSVVDTVADEAWIRGDFITVSLPF